MVQERIEIVVTDRGTRRVKRNIASIGATAQTAATGVNFLRNGLIALGAGLTVRGLLRTADAFTNVQNSLRLVTEGTQELNDVTDELLAISNRTRTSLETNADFYRRLSLATRELGKSDEELLRITESINQAIQISGTTTKEASNGLIQLSQGLSSGGLRGDELRSVLEQLPAVADVIAKQLGVTRGELRALGAEFRITSEVITEGFANAADELEAKFAKVIPTVDQSLTVLNNSFTVTIGRLNEGLGITRTFSSALIGLANNLDTVVTAVLALGGAFVGLRIGTFVQGLANARAAAQQVAAAVASGNAILLGSAQAEAAKAAASAVAARADVQKTAATLAAAQAEVTRIRTLSLQGASLAGLAAAEAAATQAEVAHTAATRSLTAAQTQYTTALKASSTQTSLFSTIVSSTTARVKQLTLALLANPLTAIITVLTTATVLLFQFRNEIRFGTNQIATLGDIAAVVWGRIVDGVGFVISAFGELLAFLSGFNPFADLQLSFEDVLRFIAAGVDTFIGLFIGLRRFLEQLASSISVTFSSLGVTLSFFFDNIGRAAKAAFEGDFADAAAITETAFGNLKDGISSSFDQIGKGAGQAFLDGFNEFNVAEEVLNGIIAEAEANRLNELRNKLGGDGGGGGPEQERLGAVEVLLEKLREEGRLLTLNAQQREVETRLVREIEQLRSQGVQVSEAQTQAIREQLQLNQQIAQAQAFAGVVANLEQQNILLQQSNAEQQVQNQLLQLRNQITGEGGTLTAEQEEQLRILVEQNLALQRQAEILNQINGPLADYEQGLMDLQTLLDNNQISQEQFNQAVRDLRIAALETSTDIGDGFERGLLKAEKGLQDLASTAEDTVTNAFNAAEDALVEFARTGELSFSGLVDSILDGLARLATQQLLNSLLSSFGGAGGIAGAIGGLFSSGATAASGGSVSKNQSLLVGEKGPEIFQPPGAGNIIPAGQTADIMAGGQPVVVPPPEVNVSVVNVQSEDDIADAMGSRSGEQAILNVIRRNRRTVRSDLA